MEDDRRRAERRAGQRRAAQRRRLALLGLAAVALAGGALAGARSGDDGADPVALAPPAACPADVAADPRRLLGQMLVVRMESVATDSLRQALRRGEIGGVVLFPDEATTPAELGVEVAKLRQAAAAGGSPPPVVTIDQEGGEVKRLAGLPPDRSPAQLAAPGAAAAEGRATGAALARIGIVADLAPVLDLAAPGGFIASRAFAADPAAVAELGIAFGEGLQTAGVAATGKHFPGLGLASTNTDLGPSIVDAARGELEPGLLPFEAAADAGFGLIMVSNALYPAFDQKRPAWRSRRVIDGLLRDRLGFDGVVISDDLGAGGLTAAGIGEGEAAVAAAEAGVDLLLFALSEGEEARASLARALRRGELDRERLLESCARVTALRERFASASGSP